MKNTLFLLFLLLFMLGCELGENINKNLNPTFTVEDQNYFKETYAKKVAEEFKSFPVTISHTESDYGLSLTLEVNEDFTNSTKEKFKKGDIFKIEICKDKSDYGKSIFINGIQYSTLYSTASSLDLLLPDGKISRATCAQYQIYDYENHCNVLKNVIIDVDNRTTYVYLNNNGVRGEEVARLFYDDNNLLIKSIYYSEKPYSLSSEDPTLYIKFVCVQDIKSNNTFQGYSIDSCDGLNIADTSKLIWSNIQEEVEDYEGGIQNCEAIITDKYKYYLGNGNIVTQRKEYINGDLKEAIIYNNGTIRQVKTYNGSSYTLSIYRNDIRSYYSDRFWARNQIITYSSESNFILGYLQNADQSKGVKLFEHFVSPDGYTNFYDPNTGKVTYTEQALDLSSRSFTGTEYNTIINGLKSSRLLAANPVYTTVTYSNPGNLIEVTETNTQKYWKNGILFNKGTYRYVFGTYDYSDMGGNTYPYAYVNCYKNGNFVSSMYIHPVENYQGGLYPEYMPPEF